MCTCILVPTDFSAPSDAALEYARTLAGTFGASLHLLHVAENVFLRAVVADPHALQAAAVDHLNDRLTEDDRQRLRAVAIMERSDKPADEIVRYARTGHIDLIVMGTHGRSGMAHLLMGCVAEHVVRTAPCPVLTVRDAPAARELEATMFTRILVPTDFSDQSDAALEYARILAAKFGASLRVLHVVQDQFVTGPLGSDMYMPPASDTLTVRLQDAQERLAHRITANDRSLLRATTEVVAGSTARTIVDYAAENGYHLIVMGTHGRSGIAHLVMGSVAESVIRTAPCPVLTVRDVRVPAAVRVGAQPVKATV